MLLLFFTLSFTYGQIQIIGPLRFQRLVGEADIDIPTATVKAVGGGYTITGYSRSFPAPDQDIYLVNTNSKGKPQWSHVYGSPNKIESAHALKRTSEGGYIITGGSQVTSITAPDAVLIKVTDGGAVQWYKEYGDVGPHLINSILELRNGYICAGYSYGLGAGNGDVLLMRVDSVGNLVFAKTLGGAGVDQARAMIAVPGGFVVLGMTKSFGAGNEDILLVKYDDTGALVWSRAIGTAGGEEARKIIKTADGGFAIAGYNGIVNAGNALLIKCDSMGMPQWAKSYGGVFDQRAVDLKRTNTEFAILGVTAKLNTLDDDPFLLRTDLNGNFIGCKKYNRTWPEAPSNMVKTPDGYFISAATNPFTSGAASLGIWDHWLIKTDRQGKSGCNEKDTTFNVNNYPLSVVSNIGTETTIALTVVNVNADAPVVSEDSLLCLSNGRVIFGTPIITGPKVSAEVTKNGFGQQAWNERGDGAFFEVYPNPVGDLLTVSFDLGGTKNATLRLVDLQGKTIQIRKLAEPFGETRIDLSGQPKGMYLLEIVEDGRRLKTVRVVRQ